MLFKTDVITTQDSNHPQTVVTVLFDVKYIINWKLLPRVKELGILELFVLLLSLTLMVLVVVVNTT